MIRDYKDLESLYHEGIRDCTLCTEDDRIRELAAEQDITKRFMFHWLPLRRGEPPFRYVFFAMEPSSTGVRQEGRYPEEGGFHAGLLFAIEKFLLRSAAAGSFLITNVAKCTIGGAACRETRNFRWNKCSDFLTAEMRLASDPGTQFISIGKSQIPFLRKQKELAKVIGRRQIHDLTHYSPRNNNRFRNFARREPQAFEGFCATTEAEYQTLLEENQHYYELAQLSDDRETSLARLFKWRADLSAVTESGGGA